MRLIFIAPPGAGKGTQSALITENYHLPQLSTGNLLRAEIKAGTPLGKSVADYINVGEFVPDEIMLQFLEDQITKDIYAKEGFILDGFPRTLYQAISLDRLFLKYNFKLDAVLILYVQKSELIKRLAARRTCLNCGASFHLEYKPPRVFNICDVCGSTLTQRKDDSEESIKTRIRNYNNLTMPIIEHYDSMNLIHRIDGVGTLDQVYARIDKVLKYLDKSGLSQ